MTFRSFPLLLAFDVGGLSFEFCVFVAGWRHALRSEWPFIIIILLLLLFVHFKVWFSLPENVWFVSKKQCLFSHASLRAAESARAFWRAQLSQLETLHNGWLCCNTR